MREIGRRRARTSHATAFNLFKPENHLRDNENVVFTPKVYNKGQRQ